MNDDPTKMQLTGHQASVIVGIERAGASLSMIGVLSIVTTYAFFKRMRTVPNTFILFASIANIGASIASLIGLAGIAKGSESALCRAQAFMLEMFMQSDPWWSFAMAFNVYLVFFHAANPTTFRRHLWVYCLVCFGLPMVPAIVCLYVHNSSKGAIYGDATLWCWIDDNWNPLRIFSYYMPIWVCIVFSAVIYVAVGYHVFHQRNQLRNLTLSNPAKDLSSSENLTRQPDVYGTVTTEVQITTDIRDGPLPSDCTPPTTPLSSPAHCAWPNDPFTGPLTRRNNGSGGSHNNLTGQHVSIDEELGLSTVMSPQAVHAGPASVYTGTSTTVISSLAPHSFAPRSWSRGGQCHYHDYSHITTRTQTASFQSPLQTHAVASQTGRSMCPSAVLGARVRYAWRRATNKLRRLDLDPVKLAYLRTSFVFAISVLVTWTPSSINRVYTLVYPTRTSYGLNIASAVVLPLQGVWNAIIYFSTSWALLREELARWEKQREQRQPRQPQDRGSGCTHRIPRISGVHGIYAIGTGDGQARLGEDCSATEMGSVGTGRMGSGKMLSPCSTRSIYNMSVRGHGDTYSGSVSGSGRADGNAASGRHDLDNTGRDSFDDESVAGVGSGIGVFPRSAHRGRGFVTAADTDAAAAAWVTPRSSPQPSTLRVQRGGELDS